MTTFQVEVISDPIRLTPNNGFLFTDPWVRAAPDYDTKIVKPAILFADHVQLVSSRSTVHHYIGMHGWRIVNMPMRQIYAFIYLSTERNPEELEQLGMRPEDLASVEDARAVEAALAKWRGVAENGSVFQEEIQPFWQRYIEQVNLMIDGHRRIWSARHDALIAPELTHAIDKGVLTVQGWVEDLHPADRMFLADEDFLAESFEGMLSRLQDPSKVALLDPTLASVAEQSRAGLTSPALLAKSIVSRLPGLNELPLIEVIDLREDLKDHLPYFRSEMIRLSEDVSEITSPEDLAAEVDWRWHRDIAPAMQEIRREVAAARYPRKLLDAITTDPAAMASAAGALAITAGGLAAGLAALLPALGAAAYPFLRAKTARDQQLSNAKTNKLFFLYALQEGLQSPP
ncbi:hypothetical protein [Micromonospora sp. RP3T]|uniref:hypothetical protein n=1 Tax=Micromonospora sp. RP3T TaxID=2135446 RepID=UPI003D747B6F